MPRIWRNNNTLREATMEKETPSYGKEVLELLKRKKLDYAWDDKNSKFVFFKDDSYLSSFKDFEGRFPLGRLKYALYYLPKEIKNLGSPADHFESAQDERYWYLDNWEAQAFIKFDTAILFPSYGLSSTRKYPCLEVVYKIYDEKGNFIREKAPYDFEGRGFYILNPTQVGVLKKEGYKVPFNFS